MAFDAIFLNLSMVAAIYLHYLRFLFVENEGFQFTFDSYFDHTSREYSLWSSYAVPYTILALGVFLIFGFYNTARFKRLRERAAFIFIGTLFANTLLILMMYFNIESRNMPRGVTLLFLVFTLLFNALPRVVKPLMIWVGAQLSVPTKADSRISRVLVIGGAGYIGSVLSRHLLESGYRVTALDQTLFGEEPISDLRKNKNFTFIKGDCRNLTEILPALEGVDAVVHLAGLVGDPACAVSEDLTIDINLASTQMLKDLCRIRGIKKFIFASTCSVYGVSSEILDEESDLNPVSLYARTKIDSESVLLKEKISGFHPTVLRFATVFGLSSRPRFDLVVNTFVGHALTKKKIDVHGGNQWRPFVHTRDIARAIELVLKAKNEKVSGQIFNVGDNKLNYTISDLAEKVKKALPETEVVNHGDSADPRNYRVKFDKIKHVLNFECLHDIDMGIKELIEEFKDVKNLNLLDPFYNNLHQAMYMVDSNSSIAINRLYKAELLEDGWVKSETPELEKPRKTA